MLKRALAVAAITVASASAHSQVLLSQGFDNVASLSGWVFTNLSTPGGTTGWYQGDTGTFSSQSGAANSYIAANYNNAAEGGTISNWLITPTFSTAQAGTVTFWARGANDAGFSDSISYGLSSTGSSETTTFALGAAVTLSGGWTQYTLSYGAGTLGSTARFGIRYAGPADTSNYIGVDTLTVAAVPEPSTWAMLGLGLAGVGVFARRKRDAA